MYTEFTNPNLVAIYDNVNPIGGYATFYLNLADDLGAQKIIDLGCGTGLLSHELARQDRNVVGVEPAPAMLEQAKRKYGDEAQWVVGSTEAIRADMQADLVVMAGHVAQFFLTDDAWQQALQNISEALKPGDHLAFESRNPHVQPFADWPTKETPSKISSTPLGSVSWWPENLQFEENLAEYELHYCFNDTGKRLISANKLHFRTKEELTKALQSAEFTVEHTYGDWGKSPLKPDSREMIFIAKKA